MLLLYLSYYMLVVSFGILWWTSSKVYNGISNMRSIDYPKQKINEDYIIIDNGDLRNDIKEIKELLKSYT